MRNLRSLARCAFAVDRSTSFLLCWVQIMAPTHAMMCSMRVANLVLSVGIRLPNMTTQLTRVAPSLPKSFQAFCIWEAMTTLRGLSFSKQSALHIS